MTMTSGTRLGPYEIVAPIGVGGMGEVYKAHDTRLGRDVAIKILPAELARDAQFKSRFEREAKTISRLSHPHICTLFDVGENYLVMELLEGESLADRVAWGPLSVSEVLKYGVQIAEALGKAHREGVIHRDLKPGNVMITKSGAKLLDFGLAKTGVGAGALAGSAAAEAAAATLQRPLTEEGVVLGTFQYMAPEQLEGIEADARTDIFALGVLLYEMVTGKRAFEGKTRASLIGAIVSGEPKPMSELRPLTPPALEHVVEKCLAKEPEDRWQNASDIAMELRWIGEAGSQAGIAGPLTIRRKVRERLTLASAALLAIAVAVIAPLYWRSASRRPPLMRVAISFPPNTEVVGPMAISPDGSRVVMALADDSGQRLWVRSLDSAAATPLAGTENGWLPFWSPDGKFIAFFADKKLKKISAGGGPAQIICDAPGGRGGTWGRDGTILFAPDLFSAIYRVPQSGGTPAAVTTLDRRRETTQRWPDLMPDGRQFIYTSKEKRSDGTERPAIMGASLDSPRRKLVVDDAAYGFYVSPGWLVFAREGTPNTAAALMAVRFDASSLMTIGDPVALPIGKIRFDGGTVWLLGSASANGTLVYQEWTPPPKSQLRWVDREGRTLANEDQPGDYGDVHPALSPDGKRVALVRDRDLWIHDVGAATSSRFTFDGLEFNADPKWSADGKRLYYVTFKILTECKLFAKSIAGAAKEVEIHQGVLTNFDISPDGRFILIMEAFAETGADIMLIDASTRRATPYVRTPANEYDPAFSPDGRWVAYAVGAGQVFVRRFPATGEQWQVTDQGGSPKWSRDGKSIFYVSNGTLMSVPVKLGATFEAGRPRKLFPCDGFAGQSPDGKRFLVLATEKSNRDNLIQVVLHWPRMLEE